MLFIGKKSQRPNVLFMGDSHADHFYAGMDVAFKHEGWTGVYLASIVYPFHGRARRLSEHYRWDSVKDKALMKWLAAHPELECVVIAQWWLERFKRVAPSVNAQDLRLFLSDIKAMGKKIVLIADTPEFDTDPLQRYVKIYTYRGGYQVLITLGSLLPALRIVIVSATLLFMPCWRRWSRRGCARWWIR